MPEDASLDQFLDAGGDPDGGSPEETGPDSSSGDDARDATTGDGPDPDDEIDLATSTYRFDTEGETCGACGQTVETRWRDGETFVCGACKSW